MKSLLKIFCCSFVVLVLNVECVKAQQNGKSENSKVIIRNANNYIAEILKDQDRQYLKGDVQLVHDSVFMYCDSAIVVENQLTAINDVVIIKPDSINVFSDSLFYDGDLKIAELYFNVVLENFEKQLFTEHLHYDLNLELATFKDTAILKKGDMHLSSIEGIYDMQKKVARFYKEVTIVDKEFTLSSDSLRYDIDIDRAYFIGPSYITQGERQIYCESGYYDVDEGRAHFTENAIIRKKDQTATAQSIFYSEIDSTVTFSFDAIIIDSTSVAKGDVIRINDKTGDIEIIGNAYYSTDEQLIVGPSIYYNKDTDDIKLQGRSTISEESGYMSGDTIIYTKHIDFGEATGNVVWKDTIENRTILSEKVFYKDSTSFYKAITIDKRPLFIQSFDDDSLYLSADTLIRSSSTDTTGFMNAYHNVKIFKADLQAKCDSLYYSDIDSSFTLIGNPICWSDTTQFVGDTIIIKIRNNQVSEIDLINNAFIISEDPNAYYDQIKGKVIHSFLDSNQIKSMHVKGNAETIYMVKDKDKAYVGANKTLCSHMSFFFENKELASIKYYSEPDSELVPFKIASEAALKLEGFKWIPNERPKSIKEIRMKSESKLILPEENKRLDDFEKDVQKVMGGFENKKIPVTKKDPVTKRKVDSNSQLLKDKKKPR